MSGAVVACGQDDVASDTDADAGDEPTAQSSTSSPFTIDPPPPDYTPIAAGVGNVVQRWGDDSTGTDEPFTMLAPTGVARQSTRTIERRGHRLRRIRRRPASSHERVSRQPRHRRGVSRSTDVHAFVRPSRRHRPDRYLGARRCPGRRPRRHHPSERHEQGRARRTCSPRESGRRPRVGASMSIRPPVTT